MIVLSREEMYACDKAAIEISGIPGQQLMENAGGNSAEFIRNYIQKSSGKVIIFCGAGNNGGDGFVIARYLKNWNYEVQIIFTGKEERFTPETRNNYNLCHDLKIPLTQIKDFEEWIALNINLNSFDLIIDAVLGVGFEGELRGWLKMLFADINKAESTRVAIDISSGTDANSGKADFSFNADHTLTMAAIKFGSLLNSGLSHAGKITVIDIGMPNHIISEKKPKGRLITNQNVVFPERKRHFHKGKYGRIAIIAGSPGFSGAAVMASRSALRAGAGLITLFHPKGMENIFETQLLEVMTKPIPDNIFELEEELSRFDTVLIGPGCGTSEKIKEIIFWLIDNWQKPLVIDADGLNIIALDHEILNQMHDREILLTPHVGEFSRLSGKTIAEIQNDPVNELESFCRKYRINVLLKSSTTIFSNGEKIVLDISGNDGLATGGSGDVLSGIIVSFCGQGLDIPDAAISASWLLGKTAEKIALKRKTPSIIPSDIINSIFLK